MYRDSWAEVWVRIKAAIAAHLLVGEEVYRHPVFVCFATRTVQAEKQDDLRPYSGDNRGLPTRSLARPKADSRRRILVFTPKRG